MTATKKLESLEIGNAERFVLVRGRDLSTAEPFAAAANVSANGSAQIVETRKRSCKLSAESFVRGTNGSGGDAT
jgi:hypothetical protein